MLKFTKDDNWFHYFETFKEVNASYYQSFGFKIIKKALLPKIDIKMMFMIKGNP